jgi:hypothetical protein
MPSTASGNVRRSGSGEDVAENKPQTDARVNRLVQNRIGPAKTRARGHAATALVEIFAIVLGATILFAVRVAPRGVTAAKRVAGRCGVCSIVSASGCAATHTSVASSGNSNTSRGAAGVQRSHLPLPDCDRPGM